MQLCQLRDGETVCVKLMRRAEVAKDRQQTSVMTEVELLRETHHPFVVSYLRLSRTTNLQILALTLLHIHTLSGGPLPLLCSRSREGGGPTPPPRTLPHSDRHSLLRDCDGLLYGYMIILADIVEYL